MNAIDRPLSDVTSARWWALYICGELDLATAPGLDARLGRAVSGHEGDGFVLDLSGLTFLDCSGLRPLLQARNRLGPRLCLRGVPARVLWFLRLAGVSDSLRILTGGDYWPHEADPERCRLLLDDLPDKRPSRPPVSPMGAAAEPSRHAPAAVALG